MGGNKMHYPIDEKTRKPIIEEKAEEPKSSEVKKEVKKKK